jgi:serine/threonine-protein kinase
MLVRFRREALLASQIRTKYAVEVLDFGEHNGAPYLVMEYLEGQDLRKLIEQRSRLEPGLAVAILEQSARGLQKAHDAGLVHRDIKPENIFLTQDEDRGMLVKLLDFGIAKSTRVESGTATGAMIGTVYYMSPEQFQGVKGLDHRTDLWSLACVGYEMLVGVRVFAGDSLLMIGMKILGEERPVPSRMGVGLPEGVDAWLAKALHPDLNRRFGSASELSVAFAQALGLSVGAWSVPPASDQPSGASVAGEFSTTAVANTEVDPRGPTAPKRAARRLFVWAAGFAVFAMVGGVSWITLKSSEKVSGAPAGVLASSSHGDPASEPPPAVASSAAQREALLLARAVMLVGEGDEDGAHRLLAGVPSDSLLRSDARFLEVENAWADRQLSEAQKLHDEEQRARLLTEVTKSGADEARRSQARSLLAALARPSAANTKKPSASKPPAATDGATPPATLAPAPPPTSSEVLPHRY